MNELDYNSVPKSLFQKISQRVIWIRLDCVPLPEICWQWNSGVLLSLCNIVFVSVTRLAAVQRRINILHTRRCDAWNNWFRDTVRSFRELYCSWDCLRNIMQFSFFFSFLETGRFVCSIQWHHYYSSSERVLGHPIDRPLHGDFSRAVLTTLFSTISSTLLFHTIILF